MTTTAERAHADRQAAYEELLAQKLAEAQEQLDAVLAIDPKDYIGKVIDYDPQPYGPRKVRINQLVLRRFKRSTWPYAEAASWVAYGTVVEGHSISRLFHATSSRDITGSSETIHGLSPRDLQTLTKTTAYCG
jgi:hypothetical protein